MYFFSCGCWIFSFFIFFFACTHSRPAIKNFLPSAGPKNPHLCRRLCQAHLSSPSFSRFEGLPCLAYFFLWYCKKKKKLEVTNFLGKSLQTFDGFNHPELGKRRFCDPKHIWGFCWGAQNVGAPPWLQPGGSCLALSPRLGTVLRLCHPPFLPPPPQLPQSQLVSSCSAQMFQQLYMVSSFEKRFFS